MAIELCYGHAISLNKNLSPSSIRYPKVSRKKSLKYECSIEKSSSPIDVERQGNVKVLNLLKTLDEREKGDRKPSHYFEDLDINNTIDSLIEEYSNVASAEEYLTSGQGEWEVFYAPHIARLSKPVDVTFHPIRYILSGDKISSNVKYSIPLVGEGWLSASGKFVQEGKKGLVLFDTFWVDRGSSGLRALLEKEEGLLDTIVNSVGKSLFFPQFSVFPVLYFDTEVVVFQFTPLKSNIAARKLGI